MKTKSIIGMLSLVLIALTTYTQASPIPVVSYKIEPITAKDTWGQGVVTPINKQNLSCYNPMSLVLEILPVGTEFKGEIIDIAGEVIQEGTTIVEIDKRRFINELKIAQETLSAKNAIVKQRESELGRSKTLQQKNVVSKQAYEEAEANYKTSIADYISAKSSLDSARIALKHCEIKAPFNGIVTKHLWSAGATRGDGDEIVEVMSVDFFLISLKDVRSNISNFLDDSMTYKIYSKHSSECTYAFNPRIKQAGKMFLIVENTKIPKVYPLKGQEGLPKIRNIFLISEYGDRLWAPISSVHNDKKGTYLYTCKKNKNAKNNDSHEWILNKIYLDINKDFVYSSILANMVLINKVPDSIKEGTTVLCDKNLSFKDGTVAFLQPIAFKFSPGETVLVNIPEAANNEGCFCVPEAALDTKNNCVFKIENGKAKKINVDVIRSMGMYYEVKSEELKKGDKIAVPKGNTIGDNAQLLIINKWSKQEDQETNS